MTMRAAATSVIRIAVLTAVLSVLTVGGAAGAQSMASVDQLVARLDLADATARVDARSQLMRRGRTALPAILKALQNPKATSRMRLEIIIWLNDMREVSADDTHGAPFAAILRAVGDPDPELADQAYLFFVQKVVAGSLDYFVPKQENISIKVKAAALKDGDFSFLFASVPVSGGATMTLKEIACYEDSSGGTTRWSFSVFANTRSFMVPEQRYGDAAKPQRYSMSGLEQTKQSPAPYSQQAPRGTARFSLLLPVSPKTPGLLRIVGYKPKHLQ